MGEDLTIESLQSIESYTRKEIEDKPSGFNSHTSTKLRIFRKVAGQQCFAAFYLTVIGVYYGRKSKYSD